MRATQRAFLAALATCLLAAAGTRAQDTGFWNALNTGVNGDVNTIVPWGNDVYVGGDFTDAGGVPNADYIAKWNGTNWEALGPGLNYICHAIAIFQGELYAGGRFVQAGGELWADRIARFDGTAWHALAIEGIGNGFVLALAASADALYIGGGFNGGLGSTGGPVNLLRWDGVQATGMFPSPTGNVDAIAVSGTDVYIGGIFLDLGGNTAIDCFARWDGSAWHQMGATLSNEVRAIAVTPGGLCIGGAFLNAGGDPAADRIARWNGTQWASLPGGGLANVVRAIAPLGNAIYAGGSFFSSTTELDAIAKWNGTGWQTVGHGLQGTVNALAVVGNDVYAGGQFLDAGGLAGADHVARWHTGVSATPPPAGAPLLLRQNHPNPFNPATTIDFELGQAAFVRVAIHDLRGRLVRSLPAGSLEAGPHALVWDGRDDAGRALASGVYVCRVAADGRVQERKLVLAK